MRVRVLVGVCALIGILGIAACEAPAPAASPSNPVAADLFARLNDERAQRGLPALAWDGDLAAMATDWAGHMAAHGIGHNPGLPGDVGENVAAGHGVSSGVHSGWMGSDGHRRNLLSPGYGTVGIGIVCSEGRIFAVADFRLAPGSGGVGGTPPAQPFARGDGPGATCG